MSEPDKPPSLSTLEALRQKMDELRKLAEAATPGPWLWPTIGGSQILTGDSWDTVCILCEWPRKKSYDHRMATWEDGRGPAHSEANARYIAAVNPATIIELDAQITALLSAYRGMKEALEPFAKIEFVGNIWQDQHDAAAVLYNDATKTSVRLGDFRRARAALTNSTEAVTRKVRVKPLVWVETEGREHPEWIAVTNIGRDWRVFQAWWGKEDKWGYVAEGGFYHTPDEAKAAAQADYEARVIAALETEE